MTRIYSRGPAAVAALTTAFGASGCDPVLNVYGSFFPAWVVSLLIGVVLTLLVRLLLLVTRIEAHLGLLLLVYPSLAFLLTCLTWLTLFRS